MLQGCEMVASVWPLGPASTSCLKSEWHYLYRHAHVATQGMSCCSEYGWPHSPGGQFKTPA
eukprot:13750858-Alexandrium_andersonii.AAC.1